MEQFKAKFDKYACINDSISCEIDGIEYQAHILFDHDSHIDDDDCHNLDQSVTGCTDAQNAQMKKAKKAWYSDEWFFCGIVLSAHKSDVTLDDHAASLWGIECNYPDSDNGYLSDVANELLPEAIEYAQAILEKLAA